MNKVPMPNISSSISDDNMDDIATIMIHMVAGKQVFMDVDTLNEIHKFLVTHNENRLSAVIQSQLNSYNHVADVVKGFEQDENP